MTKKQREKIIRLFPMQRGNVKVDNNLFLDAILYVSGNGCSWRSLPASFGRWHTIYMRINRWAKNGTLERIFQALQEEGLADRRIREGFPNSGAAKARPGPAGGRKKGGKPK
ncbi:MAG: transposase [Treponema sp.]|nr:transposase [Treponema sp.]